MSIQNSYYLLQNFFINLVCLFFETIAKWLGYPENPGMPVVPPENYPWEVERLNANLPVLTERFPPSTDPKNYFHVLFTELN